MKFSFSNKTIESIVSITAHAKNAACDLMLSEVLADGIRFLIGEKELDSDCIGAIVTVSATPDRFFPQLSCDVHRILELSEEVACYDLMEGSSGYIYGLIQSLFISDHMNGKKVILCTGDFFNRSIPEPDSSDKNEVATVTVISDSGWANKIICRYYDISVECEAYVLPAPRWMYPVLPDPDYINVDLQTAYDELKPRISESYRPATEAGLRHLIQDMLSDSECPLGNADYVFLDCPKDVQTDDILNKSNLKDKLIFHAEDSELHEQFSSYLPYMIVNEKADVMKQANPQRIALLAYGAGVSAGGIVLDIGEMTICRTLERWY